MLFSYGLGRPNPKPEMFGVRVPETAAVFCIPATKRPRAKARKVVQLQNY